MQCNAMQCNAMQSKAKQSKARQCKTMQCNAMQCKAGRKGICNSVFLPSEWWLSTWNGSDSSSNSWILSWDHLEYRHTSYPITSQNHFLTGKQLSYHHTHRMSIQIQEQLQQTRDHATSSQEFSTNHHTDWLSVKT